MIQKMKNYIHLCEALVATIVYGFPSFGMTVIGVTGTDGKTTTTSLIYHILKENGYNTAMISTVGAVIGNTTYDIGFHVTTPSSFSLQKYIKQAKGQGVKYLVLEVTSHALDQNRVFGIPFTIGVLTNVTHEHLDYHKSYETYLRTKATLLVSSSIAVLNKDDQSFSFLSALIQGKKVLTYSLIKKGTSITPKTFSFKTTLPGTHNQMNCLAAILTAKQLGIPDSDIRKALLSFNPPPGRAEIIYDKEFRVMVDFAHTPNAFKLVLPMIKKQTNGRLIHVFGAASKRDESKRPIMGKYSETYADVIILTAEDPRGESVEQINKQIAYGFSKSFKNYYSIPDRKKAIERAISMAKKGDMILLTGKGHEKSINYGHGEEPWDEKEIALETINKLKIKKSKVYGERIKYFLCIFNF